MTPSERERRNTGTIRQFSCQECGEPNSVRLPRMVSSDLLNEERRLREKAEAAARDFAKALNDIAGLLSLAEAVYAPGWAQNALARHPSFSGEEGTEG